MQYKYILFDLDDTLLDFQKAQKNAFKILMDHYALIYSDKDYSEYDRINSNLWQSYERGELSRDIVLTKRFEDFFAKFGIQVDGNEADAIYRESLEKGDQLFEHTIDVLNHFKKSHRLAIVTNGVYRTQMARLKENGLLPYFEEIFVSDQIGFQKPDGRFFVVVCQTLQIDDRQEALIVGDSLTADIFGGQQAGLGTCWINHHHDALPKKLQPTFVINNLKELLDFWK